MVCVCCGKSYCHKKSPCARDLRIQVSWCGVSGVSSRIIPVFNGRCGNALGEGNSGNGVFRSDFLGTCPGQTESEGRETDNYINVMLGTGYVLNQRFGGLSCCRRVSLDGAVIEGGSVTVNITRWMSARWSFGFPDLAGGATVVKTYVFEDPAFAGSCWGKFSGLWNACKETPPTLQLLGADVDPGNFCSANETEDSYPAIKGPFSTAECDAQCLNPLP